MARDMQPAVLVISSAPLASLSSDAKLLLSRLDARHIEINELEAHKDAVVDVVISLDPEPDASSAVIEASIREIRTHFPDHPLIHLSSSAPPSKSPGALGTVDWVQLPSDGTLEATLVEGLVRTAAACKSARGQLAHYREVLETAPIGIFRIRNGELIYLNEYLLERTGADPDNLATLKIVDLLAPEERARAMQQLASVDRRPPDAPPNIYKFLLPSGEILVGEVRSWVVGAGKDAYIEGTILNITQETRILQLHRVVLELTEVILAEQEIDRILQSVLDTITEYSGFRRAVLSLYDLSIPVPFEGAIHKLYAAGLGETEREQLFAQDPMPAAQRKLVFSEKYKLGPAYYIPHDRIPWDQEIGISGTTTVDGWHQDDFLFIPLRGEEGIIGAISVDDPIDLTAPTIASIEPVAFLANFAAFAVERVFKMQQLRKRTAQLHGLASLGAQLARITDERSLCDTAVSQVVASLEYDVCGIWLLDGVRFVHESAAVFDQIPGTEIPARGDRVSADGPGITRWVLRNGESVIIPDVREDSRYDGTRESIRSYLATPIVGRKGVIGVLYAASQSVAAFSEQDLEILGTVASQLSTALSALRRRAALTRIYAFGQRLTMASTREQAVSRTLDFLVEQFDFQLTSILMHDDEERLCVAGIQGDFRESGIHVGWEADKVSGVIGWVYQNRRSALVPDVSRDERYYNAYSGTNAELAVPILFDERLVGIINIESPQVGFFDEEDRQLIEVVAAHLATALSNIESQADLREQAIRDPLTSLFNRHYFNTIIASELSRGDRYNRPMALMMIDIDGFRAVNNKLGHLVGDEVLCRVAEMLTSSMRESDRVIRYGGDEFLIFMPETNGSGHAEIIAERLRSQIADVVTDTPAAGLPIGLSIGIYKRSPREEHSLEYILEEVDRRMYADKRARHEERADEYRR